MLPAIVSFFTFRTVILLFSTTFSILAVMMMLNIVTPDDVAAILNLSPKGTVALKSIVERFQEVSGNITNILSQLLNKLFGWAGLDIDLSKIKVDLNDSSQNGGSANAVNSPDNVRSITDSERHEGAIQIDQWKR
ncbi:MAG: hypothetical protein ACJAW3_001233 [Lentimonas sp.]|jgi:hypothetical protein